MIIKRGILQSFDPSTYTVSVLLFEATSYALTGIPIANHFDRTSAIAGTLCAILFFDEHNPQDAVVISTFANGSSGLPTPPPGRLTFVTGFRQIFNDTIAAGSTHTYTLSGGSSGIPLGVLGVLYKANFTSSTIGASIHLAPHAATDITAYNTVGNLTVANSSIDGMGTLAVDTMGQIDIQANTGACTITLYTYGYVM